jgi:hypothetical protein
VAVARGDGEGVGDGRGVGVASGVPGFGYEEGERSDSIETLGSFRIVGSDARRPSGEAVGSCATANDAVAAIIVSKDSSLVFIVCAGQGLDFVSTVAVSSKLQKHSVTRSAALDLTSSSADEQ